MALKAEGVGFEPTRDLAAPNGFETVSYWRSVAPHPACCWFAREAVVQRQTAAFHAKRRFSAGGGLGPRGVHP